MTARSNREYVQIDPRQLRLPSTMPQGADPVKLMRQTAKHGASVVGMLPPLVVRGKDGELQLIDGVTRATRVAKRWPGQAIAVEVVDTRPKLDMTRFPLVGDRLP